MRKRRRMDRRTPHCYHRISLLQTVVVVVVVVVVALADYLTPLHTKGRRKRRKSKKKVEEEMYRYR